ncbi:ATP-dependent endonuclease [Paracoccus sp. IB05]|uniref:ATP-dependent nuclease n=1 Tax=Paracoccus sp. IB05 TaxID=2779367 RepID=UPI0018E7DD5A|nr:AAA family ATPase [Paracoccus sp. IB05]MBJ2153957.1 AAA family ATPase [Paracoccus sp. IB05]
MEKFMPENRSKLVRLNIKNIGCIGPEGLTVEMDDIVCIVGKNNAGKSTVLRSYELAQGSEKFDWSRDRYAQASEDQPSEVVLEIHIPDGLGNVGAEWKRTEGDFRILTSRWQWWQQHLGDSKNFPIRQTLMPGQPIEENEGYAQDGKAGGADNVFKSRLPQPVRIGSRNDPAEAEKALLKLVLEPVVTALATAAASDHTALFQAVSALQESVQGIVAEQAAQFEDAVQSVEKGLSDVFPGLAVKLNVKSAPPKFDVSKLVGDGSGLRITDGGSEVQLSQQGAGAQRALFWTMLQVRNQLESDKKVRDQRIKDLGVQIKKVSQDPVKSAEVQAQMDAIRAGGVIPRDEGDPALPGYILLIDEPENALHPLAARAAQRQLYQLAQQPEWQVMMTTHSTLFVNPAVDHTTILRLEREEAGAHLSPRTYRTDTAGFTEDEKDVLKAIQEMDPTFCEVFFGSYPIVVEGDTEHAAFIAAVVEVGHELIDHVTIIKTRGKPQLRAVMRMLIHFRKNFGVIHDCDWPYDAKRSFNADGQRKKSGSWSHNLEIRKLVNSAKSKGVCVSHEVSIPDFERRIGLPRGAGGKPFEAYGKIKESAALKKYIQDLLTALKSPQGYAEDAHPDCDASEFVADLLVKLTAAATESNWDDSHRADGTSNDNVLAGQ